MLKQLVTKVLGTRFDRELKRIQPIVDAIHRHEERLRGLGDAEVQAQTAKFRGVIAQRRAITAEWSACAGRNTPAPTPERLRLDADLGKAEAAQDGCSRSG
jgi:preprotein translocase subunit SecA